MTSVKVPLPLLAADLATAVVVSSATPLVLLDGDLLVVAASMSFCEAFALAPDSVTGCTLAALGSGEWNRPQLESLLRATVAGHASIDSYEMDLARPGQPVCRLVLNVRKLAYGEGTDTRLLLAVADVTMARAAKLAHDELLREKAFLLQELQHRVANSLQIIASVLLQSARRVQSDEARIHLQGAHQRVMSVAAVQRQLSASTHDEVGLRGYLIELCQSLGASMIRDATQIVLDVQADDSVAKADVSVSLGLVVTELVINALKHAFPEGRSGRVTVSYHSDGPDWTLSVRDDGVGMAQDASPTMGGLGTSIVQALARQLRSVVTVRDGAPGTNVSLVHHVAPETGDVTVEGELPEAV